MRYLVQGRVRRGRERDLLHAIQTGELGRGSIAGDECQRNMQSARLLEDGSLRWVETCFCTTPLQEERPYWEEYFTLESIKDAHSRKNCRHENGTEPWACCDCDCTEKLKAKLAKIGEWFLDKLSHSA